MIGDHDERRFDALARIVREHPAWAWLTRTALSARLTKYALGSVIAFVLGNIAFVAVYVAGGSTTACSVVGFVAAAIPNWILNRRWAWKQEGRPPARQVVGYAAVSALVLYTTSAATGWTNSHLGGVPDHHGLRALIVTSAYVAVTIFWFFAKFVIYDFWIFSERSRVRAALRSLAARRSVRTDRAR